MRHHLFTASIIARGSKTSALDGRGNPARIIAPYSLEEQATRLSFWQQVNAELRSRGRDEAMAGEIGPILDSDPRPSPLIAAAKIIWDRGRHE